MSANNADSGAADASAEHESQRHNCKCVVVGDGGVGKTFMLSVYAKKKLPDGYVQTIFDNYTATVDVDGTPVLLNLWDTAGQEEYDVLRTLSYRGTSVFIVCFSVDNRASYANVASKWVPDARPHSKTAAILLVGTKGDLRGSPDLEAGGISEEDCQRMKHTIGAVKYMECSAFQNVGIKEVFDEAIRISLGHHEDLTATPAGCEALEPPASSPQSSPTRKKKPSEKKGKKCTIL